jgi:hypothetical protein
MENLSSTQGLSLTTIPRPILMLAEALSRLHGPAVIRNESNGYHIYLPSPECLKTDGRKEIQSRHLTVNASRYKQTDDWVRKHGAIKEQSMLDFSAICHKTNTKFRVTDLLNEKKFPPLEKRGLPNISSKIICAATQRTESLVDDGKGNMVPMDPGEVIPINQLPPYHPAVEYLKSRNYDLDSLYHQFRCSYCIAEQPENPAKGIFYKRLPLDFKDTPQGRIVFYSMINGVQVGWQARILEKTEDDVKFYWHPYKQKWTPVQYKNNDTGKWDVFPGVEIKDGPYPILWKPSKYKTATGMTRNETLMGVDAAMEFNKKFKLKKPVVFLVEGPLDAGRIGPGAVALLGKYFSENQASVLLSRFKKIVLVSDNDKAGNELKERVTELLHDKLVELVFAEVPAPHKDVGDMSTEAALNLLLPLAIT